MSYIALALVRFGAGCCRFSLVFGNREACRACQPLTACQTVGTVREPIIHTALLRRRLEGASIIARPREKLACVQGESQAL